MNVSYLEIAGMTAVTRIFLQVYKINDYINYFLDSCLAFVYILFKKKKNTRINIFIRLNNVILSIYCKERI